MNPTNSRELLRFVLGVAFAASFGTTGIGIQPAFAASDTSVAATPDDSPLTASRMFQILTADLAIQRGEFAASRAKLCDALIGARRKELQAVQRLRGHGIALRAAGRFALAIALHARPLRVCNNDDNAHEMML